MARPKQDQRHGTQDQGRAPTLADVTDLPFVLAGRWAAWPADPDRTAADQLAELAVMSALRIGLDRLIPQHVHTTVCAGGSLAQVVAATGLPTAELALQWHRWALPQRQWRHRYGHGGITDDAYRQVAAALGIREAT